jgi:hypothetical protein
MPAKESVVQKQILEWLAAKHILAFRMQTGSAIKSYGGKTRKISFGVPGMADILAFPNKRSEFSSPEQWTQPTWIEVKAAKGKQSELQKSFQQQVEEAGHTYVICRCIEDLEGIL